MLCWGSNNVNQVDDTLNSGNPGTKSWASVSAGWYTTCGIRSNNHTAECWGNNLYGQRFVDPSNAEWSALSAGEGHACGVTGNNTFHCWGCQPPGGDFDQGQCSIPKGMN